MPDYTGSQLGNWRLERLLGAGSFGAVYLGRNPVIGREAAVKVLHPHFAFDAAIRRRFFDEARAAGEARLVGDEHRIHPGVVQIFDGDDGSHGSQGLCYIVMERLIGHTLHDALSRRTLSSRETACLGEMLADTLAAVHRRGVIHRDLKPENIFLQQEDPGRPKILDFGIAKLREGGDGTAPGTVLGTPQYMSPEQAQGLADLDARADLYSLGIILFECRTGSVPFKGTSYHQVIWQHLSKPVPDPRSLAPDTPDELAQIIRDLLAKDKAARPCAEEARDRLRRVVALLQEERPGDTVPAPVPVVTRRLSARSLALGLAVPLLLLCGAVVLLRPSRARVAPPPPVAAPAPPPVAAPAPPVPRPPPLPEGMVAQGPCALSLAQIQIGEFRRFAEVEHVVRPGPDRWPWEVRPPLSAELPMNNISREQAQRYCQWRYGAQGRLPRRAELQQAAARLRSGPLSDMAGDEEVRGNFSFRCAIDLPAPAAQ